MPLTNIVLRHQKAKDSSAIAGLLSTFSATAQEHLLRLRQNLQQQPQIAELQQRATQACRNLQGIGNVLLQTAATMHTSNAVVEQAGSVSNCVHQLHVGLLSMLGSPRPVLPVTPALLTDFHHLLLDQHKVQGVLSLAQQLQHDAQSTATYIIP